MSALIIDGKALSNAIQDRLRLEADEVSRGLGRKVGLAVVLVGENPASKVYVRNKTKSAERCGIAVKDVHLAEDIDDIVLQRTLRNLSTDTDIDGILLQLPLPAGLDEYQALLAIDSAKDADGLHPENQGKLLRGAPCPRPCTPAGCMELIDHARRELGLPAELKGLRAAVVGRSILVGKPVALMLLERHCTVTQCHSRTVELPAEVRRADIVIAAVGKARMVTADFVKPGAIVIDVGINRLADGSLVGDVDFDSAREVASAITPVPGGVGPMTIAMLLKNTVEAARDKL